MSRSSVRLHKRCLLSLGVGMAGRQCFRAVQTVWHTASTMPQYRTSKRLLISAAGVAAASSTAMKHPQSYCRRSLGPQLRPSLSQLSIWGRCWGRGGQGMSTGVPGMVPLWLSRYANHSHLSLWHLLHTILFFMCFCLSCE